MKECYACMICISIAEVCRRYKLPVSAVRWLQMWMVEWTAWVIQLIRLWPNLLSVHLWREPEGLDLLQRNLHPVALMGRSTKPLVRSSHSSQWCAQGKIVRSWWPAPWTFLNRKFFVSIHTTNILSSVSSKDWDMEHSFEGSSSILIHKGFLLRLLLAPLSQNRNQWL